MIGKIAAGEVVERPASVVKELVENAIDAGAKEISVVIEAGGKERIVVIDDGCGMEPDDVKLSVTRHATSKIATVEDLDSIHTMGFRGEALPSIAAVSKMTIETKPVISPKGGFETIAGTKLVVAGGRVIESGDFGCPAGTKVLVSDLFFNTPARKKFLRGDKTEEGHVGDTVIRLALAFPEIRFKLTTDGRERLSCLSTDDPRTRLLEVFSSAAASTAVSFEEKGNGIRVHGFLGKPDSSRMVAQGVYIFVNRRYVKDRLLNHAVADGYRSLLPHGSYPFAIVMLDVDPTRVDVNVHPTKQEVRFDNSGAVHNFVAAAVRKVVQKRQCLSVEAPKPALSGVEGCVSQEDVCVIASPKGVAISSEQFSPEFSNLSTYAPTHLRTFFSSLHVIGQLANSYILCEGEGGKFVAIDQHAAHERIGFEKLRMQTSDRRIERQQLLIPEQVELAPREAAYITEHLEQLSGTGLEIEPFGGKTFVIKSVPVLLADTDIKSLILKLARELAEIGKSSGVEELTEHILKTMACHRQVRANHRLSVPEMHALLKEMDQWPNTTLCPHGRPSYIEFSAEDVGRWFKR